MRIKNFILTCAWISSGISTESNKEQLFPPHFLILLIIIINIQCNKLNIMQGDQKSPKVRIFFENTYYEIILYTYPINQKMGPDIFYCCHYCQTWIRNVVSANRNELFLVARSYESIYCENNQLRKKSTY